MTASKGEENPEVLEAIVHGIRNRKHLDLTYRGDKRTVEPLGYGFVNGRRELLCYQIAGTSRSGPLPDWRTFLTRDISAAVVLPTSFAPEHAVNVRSKFDLLIECAETNP